MKALCFLFALVLLALLSYFRGVSSEQTKPAALHTFQIVVFPSRPADGIAAHFRGHEAPNGGVEVASAALAHGSDDVLGGKGPVGALATQLASDSKNFITASHGSILPGLQARWVGMIPRVHQTQPGESRLYGRGQVEVLQILTPEERARRAELEEQILVGAHAAQLVKRSFWKLHGELGGRLR